MRKAAYRGRECHSSCVPTYLHYLFSCFWQHFCLIVSCFICRNVTLSFIKTKCVHQKRLFFSNKTNFCCREISLFYLKFYFCEAKLAKMLLILIKWNLRYTLYFHMIPYIEKTLCAAQRRKYGLLYFFYFIKKII